MSPGARSRATEPRRIRWRSHTLGFILVRVTAVRRTISLPPSVAARLDEEARRRGTSFSAIVTELVQREPAALPYAGLIDDDENLSLKIQEILSRAPR
jgi:hypothetical protein